jgi:DNA-binding GntR family transcriptional regulator
MPAGPLDSPIRNRRPLRETVYQRLKEAILEGQLEPGQHLVETDLAARLGVSRNPVREALRKLEQEQLVLASTQGLIVSSLTPERIEEIYGIRAVLEAQSCELAAARITPEECERLRQCLDCARSAIENEDLRGLTQCDIEFHEILISAARNATLKRVLDQLREYVYRMRYASTALRGRPQEVLRDHSEIAQAVIAGDAQLAGELVHRHVVAAGQRLATSLQTGHLQE